MRFHRHDGSPCPPYAALPTAAPAAPTSPSGEGSTVGGVEVCCIGMRAHKIVQAMAGKARMPPGWPVDWTFCPWCGAKIGEGER